jgi:hypothetical protein
MSDLLETPVYEPGIYQLETTDPVMGGANGVDNLQAKQLANRTAWLNGKTVRTVLLTKTQDQLLVSATTNVISFDQIVTNDDDILPGVMPVSGIAVPAGYAYARLSATVTLKTSANNSSLLYGLTLSINGSNQLALGTGQSTKHVGAYFYVGEFLAMNIVTPIVPVQEGDYLGILQYVSSSYVSAHGGRCWMQVEFIK